MATVYGDNEILDDCVAAFKAEMDSLLSAMISADDDPRPAAIYSGHEQLKMSLPAISVDLESENPAVGADIQGDKFKGGSGREYTSHYQVMISIRIHTAFHEGYRDNQKIRRLINSVINWLQTHKDSVDSIIQGTSNVSSLGFNMGDITTGDVFEESLTLGGTVPVVIDLTVSHIQI